MHPHTTDFKKLLNPSQLKAVTTVEGPLLVIAGAGSGKTRVIEYRVLHLVQNNVQPNSILLLTFTRKASRSMLERAAKHDPRCAQVEGGTFHSFAYRMLKRYSKSIGFADSFTIIDEADAEEAVRKCSVELGFIEREKRFPRKDTLRSIISASLNRDLSIADILDIDYPHFSAYAGDIEKLRKLYIDYKLNKNYLDYDDLLLYLKILLEKSEVRASLAKKYHYLMVDEYQDTNRLQGDITYMLAQDHRNIMVVGDDAQSIYGFRGASHENIMQFPAKFSGCQVIKLEENYRSTQTILDLANSVLANMENKYNKCLVSAKDDEGEKPALMFFKDSDEEAEWIAGKIKEFRDDDIDLSHQAVLFRSAYISIPLQAALSRRDIPYQVFGGMKFYETAHVRDLLAHIKVLMNPKDELAWNRLLQLIEGIGPITGQKITEAITSCHSFEEGIEKGLAKYTQGHKFSKMIERLKKALQAASAASSHIEEQYVLLYQYYSPLMMEKFDDWNQRNNDLETLQQICGRYTSLEEFLADFAIEPPERGVAQVEAGSTDPEKPLTLSTIHSAKGLEWEIVYFIGLAEGVLPVSFALDKADEIEEEHRLFYVGVTRAKKHLYLTVAHEGSRGGITQFNKISRFVDVANVLAHLDKDVTYTDEEDPYDDLDAHDDVSLYDKAALKRRLDEYFE